MLFSSVQRKIFALLSLLNALPNVASSRIVTFKYVEDSATCGSGDAFDLRLENIHIDCGNANHGCTPGHSMLLYGEFEANDSFSSVADVEMGACLLGTHVCYPNIVETKVNLCQDLELWDLDGYQTCNKAGSYTFEASYMLPNRTWWGDFAFKGFAFNIYITLDNDLTCHAKFVTNTYYGNETWMAFAVGSLALALSGYYYVQRKRQQARAKVNLEVEEAKAGEYDDAGDVEMQPAAASPPPKKEMPQRKKKNKRSARKKAPPVEGYVSDVTMTDDESVTTTAYSRMLDFSPEGLDHADEIEQARQAHFERLRKIRKSRRAPSIVPLSPSQRLLGTESYNCSVAC